jgi:hypothetical protein
VSRPGLAGVDPWWWSLRGLADPGARCGRWSAGIAVAPAPETAGGTAEAAAGLPLNALGQFTSGAGGESAATAAGRSAHASYPNTLGWSSADDVAFNQAMRGSNLRPDAVNYTQRIVRELKPDNPRAIADGWRQVNGYKDYLEELTGESWTAYVDVYTP